MIREYVPKVVNGQVRQVRVGKLPKVLVKPDRFCGWCGHKGIWMDNKFIWHCPKCNRNWSEE